MLKKFLPQSEFAKNIVTLTSGTTIAQVIPFLITPFLSRLYPEEDFGVFAVYMSIALILSVLATGRYELAILLPKERKEAINIMGLSMSITLFWTVLIAISLPLLISPLRLWSDNHEVINWLFILPLSVLFMGWNQALGYWSNRNKKYKLLSAAKITQSGATAGTKLTGGLVNPSPFGLIIGNVIGYAIAVVVYAINFIKHDVALIKELSLSQMKTLSKRYVKFPKYDMTSGIMNTFSSQIPILLLAFYFNTAVVGWYSLAHTILKMPMTFIGNSVGQVFFQHSSDIKTDGERLTTTTFSLFKKLFWIGILPMALVGGFGDVIFEIVLGKNWYNAGVFAQYLSPWLLLVFVASPISHILNVLEKQQINLIFNITIIALRIMALVVGGLVFNDPLVAVILFGAVSFFAWFVFASYLLFLAGVNLGKVIVFTLPKLIIATIVMYGLRMLIL